MNVSSSKVGWSSSSDDGGESHVSDTRMSHDSKRRRRINDAIAPPSSLAPSQFDNANTSVADEFDANVEGYSTEESASQQMKLGQTKTEASNATVRTNESRRKKRRRGVSDPDDDDDDDDESDDEFLQRPSWSAPSQSSLMQVDNSKRSENESDSSYVDSDSASARRIARRKGTGTATDTKPKPFALFGCKVKRKVMGVVTAFEGVVVDHSPARGYLIRFNDANDTEYLNRKDFALVESGSKGTGAGAGEHDDEGDDQVSAAVKLVMATRAKDKKRPVGRPRKVGRPKVPTRAKRSVKAERKRAAKKRGRLSKKDVGDMTEALVGLLSVRTRSYKTLKQRAADLTRGTHLSGMTVNEARVYQLLRALTPDTNT
jgi:hypothetical protein